MAQNLSITTAVDDVVSHIVSYGQLPDGVRVFAYEKTKDTDGDYIAVNHLPYQHSQFDVNEAIININIHAKDNLKGQISTTRLNELVNKVISLFKVEKEMNGNWFELSSISNPYSDDDKTHFVNLRIQVNYSNF